MSLGPGIRRRTFVKKGRAYCHECGKKVQFLADLRAFAQHPGKKGDQWCRPSYDGVAFVFPDGTELKNPSSSNPRPAKPRLTLADKAHQHAPQQYTPHRKSSKPTRSESKSGRKTGSTRRARQEDRSWQRRMERYAMADPFEPTSIQDFDVPDTGTSVRAKHGGIPSSSRRRH